VIVRGKTGADVEFGNTLLIAEQAQGLVVDWCLHRESAPADNRQLEATFERMEARIGAGVIEAVCGDRGFDSAANQELLAGKKVFNGLCPRGAEELRRRRQGKRFGEIQRRRPQTEGRIAILKNDFFGRPMRAKGYEHRALIVSWRCSSFRTVWHPTLDLTAPPLIASSHLGQPVFLQYWLIRIHTISRCPFVMSQRSLLSPLSFASPVSLSLGQLAASVRGKHFWL